MMRFKLSRSAMRTAIGTTVKANISGATVMKRNISTRRGSEEQAGAMEANASERREQQGEEREDRGETWAEEMGRSYEERAMGVRAMRRGGGREERAQGSRLRRFPRLPRLKAVRMRQGDATKSRASSHSTPQPGKLLL